MISDSDAARFWSGTATVLKVCGHNQHPQRRRGDFERTTPGSSHGAGSSEPGNRAARSALSLQCS